MNVERIMVFQNDLLIETTETTAFLNFWHL